MHCGRGLEANFIVLRGKFSLLPMLDYAIGPPCAGSPRNTEGPKLITELLRAGWRMPNALILEYQKSLVWHAPSRLHKRWCAAGIDLDRVGETTGSALLHSLLGWAFVD